MNYKQLFSLFSRQVRGILAGICCLSLTFSLCACSDNSNDDNNNDNGINSYVYENKVTATTPDVSDMFSASDLDSSYDTSKATLIELSDNNSIVTINTEGTYILSGKISDGQVIVDADKTDKIQLVLDNVDITNKSSAAIYVKQADKVFITSAENSVNTLCTSGEFVNSDSDTNNVDAVIFSKDDLTLNGPGTLTISTENGHGIVSKNDLKITEGSYHINASSTALTGKDSVRICGGAFTLISGKDSIHSENEEVSEDGFIYISGGTFDITGDGDGISASASLTIDGGVFNIVSGGGSENAPTHTGINFGKGMNSDKDRNFDKVKNLENGNINMPQMPDGATYGDMPQMPDGIAPSEMPQMPDDAAPGDMPQMPQVTSDNENSASSTAVAQTDDTTSSKGIKSDTSIIISGGTFNIDCADDAIHSNETLEIYSGTFNIASGDDGIHADGDLHIYGGVIDISTSYEGIEGNTITVDGGNITLTSSDDGLNASGATPLITINAGNITVNAEGDGLDSNDDIIVNGGETYIFGPTSSGNGAIDYESSATITGGIVVAIGSTGMAQNFGNNSTQGCMLVNISGNAEDQITLTDSNNNVIVSCTSPKSFSCVVISSPDIKEGSSYTLTAGNSSTSIEMTSLIFGNGGGFGGGAGGGKGFDHGGGFGGNSDSRGGFDGGFDGGSKPDSGMRNNNITN